MNEKRSIQLYHICASIFSSCYMHLYFAQLAAHYEVKTMEMCKNSAIALNLDDSGVLCEDTNLLQANSKMVCSKCYRLN